MNFPTQKAGPQPTDIFGGGAKRCNLLLYLTNTYVCENFGGEISPPLVAGLSEGIKFGKV